MDEIKIERLDFSMFHGLDHWPGSAYCRSQYGGWRRHLKLAWEFKWRGRTLCLLGLHEWCKAGDSTGWTGQSCWFCSRRKENP